jgi:hypothetical protein
VRYWHRGVFHKVQSLAGEPFDRVELLVEANCTDLTWRGVQMALYLGERHLSTEPMEMKAERSAPGTAGDNLIRFACRRR